MPGFDPDKLLQAMMEIPPEFDKDGFVTKVEKSFVYGEPMIQYYNWGSFMPDKSGKDLVRTTVEADVPLNENIHRLKEQGICKIEDLPDGKKAVIYRGINRGAYLALGDLQQAVIHVLQVIKNSGSMKKLMESAKI